jgi:hypothetical protein
MLNIHTRLIYAIFYTKIKNIEFDIFLQFFSLQFLGFKVDYLFSKLRLF